MRFLLNMNLPRALSILLAAHGHICRHAGDIGPARASDVAILDAAKRNQEAIVTHDLDYGHLLAFSGESSPSVVILRVRNTHPDHLLTSITRAWSEIASPLNDWRDSDPGGRCGAHPPTADRGGRLR